MKKAAHILFCAVLSCHYAVSMEKRQIQQPDAQRQTIADQRPDCLMPMSFFADNGKWLKEWADFEKSGKYCPELHNAQEALKKRGVDYVTEGKVRFLKDQETAQFFDYMISVPYWSDQLFSCIAQGKAKQIKDVVARNPFVLNRHKKIAMVAITPLIYAVSLVGDDDCMKKLLKLGAQGQSVDSNNVSVLCYIAQNRADLAQLLIKHGADVNHKDCNGNTPLMGFVSWHRQHQKADIKPLNNYLTLLNEKKFKQLAGNDLAVMYCLLCRGTRLDEQDNDGNTALHKAVMLGRSSEGILLLLAYGADCSVFNKAGKTVLDIAQEGLCCTQLLPYFSYYRDRTRKCYHCLKNLTIDLCFYCSQYPSIVGF